MKPANWPDEFAFSPISTYLGFVAHVLLSPHPEDQGKNDPYIAEKKVHPQLEIKILSDDHPLTGQRGVFATAKLEPFTPLGEYVGEVFIGAGDPSMFPRKDVHCWFVERNGISLQISSHRIANELAFINDYRGLQPTANIRLHWTIHKGMYHFGYITAKAIEPGEELLVDYGNKWATNIEKAPLTTP